VTHTHFTGPVAENSASTCLALHLVLWQRDRLGVICWCWLRKIKTKGACDKLALPTAAELCTHVASIRSASLNTIWKTKTEQKQKHTRWPLSNRGIHGCTCSPRSWIFGNVMCICVFVLLRIKFYFSLWQGKLILLSRKLHCDTSLAIHEMYSSSPVQNITLLPVESSICKDK